MNETKLILGVMQAALAAINLITFCYTIRRFAPMWISLLTAITFVVCAVLSAHYLYNFFYVAFNN